MWLISDGTTGLLSSAIVVDRAADIPDAIARVARYKSIQEDEVVVNPIGPAVSAENPVSVPVCPYCKTAVLTNNDATNGLMPADESAPGCEFCNSITSP